MSDEANKVVSEKKNVGIVMKKIMKSKKAMMKIGMIFIALGLVFGWLSGVIAENGLPVLSDVMMMWTSVFILIGIGAIGYVFLVLDENLFGKKGEKKLSAEEQDEKKLLKEIEDEIKEESNGSPKK